ncbi:MAG: hypothetical protein P4L84_04510 [Isosphaeraceae bacterium]|nr:hypothetical protein [Isosphaeraceae bacterium]
MAVDPILTLRLETLEACLNDAREPDWWLTRLAEDADEARASEEKNKGQEHKEIDRNREPDDFLNGFFGEIRGRVIDHSEKINKAMQEAPADAWSQYDKLDRETTEIFRECFDCLGGRFLREHRLDDKLFRHADALFREWNGIYRTRAFPTALAPLRMKFRRIARLRLPGCLWAIPYVAAEYGHFLIEDQNRGAIQDRRRSQTEKLRRHDSEIKRIRPKGRQKTAARELVEDLFADVFGTYLLGPAYACSALTMKLNPHARARGVYVDVKRAWVILQTLKTKIKPSGPGGDLATPDGLQHLVDWLDEHWNKTLAHTKSGVNEEDAKLLTQFVDDFFGPLAQWKGYQSFGIRSGWRYTEQWGHVLAEGREVDNLDGGSLTDAFNASWYARYLQAKTRFADPPNPTDSTPPAEQLESLTKRSLALCEKVLIYQQKIKDERPAALKTRSGRALSPPTPVE